MALHRAALTDRASDDPLESLTAILSRPAPEAARALIGAELRVGEVGGIVVETEAYDALDPASHSFRGPTARNAAMFGPPGRLYVYRIYGLHWCLNVVCDAATPGSAVLIRALEPVWGLDLMRERRGPVPDRTLCAGPGRLCLALGVTGQLDGSPVDGEHLRLAPGRPGVIQVASRVGIRHGAQTPWRFGREGSPYLSRPFPRASLGEVSSRRTSAG